MHQQQEKPAGNKKSMGHKRRIEKKSSRTAAYTCMCRASSYLEKNTCFSSEDYIAVELLPRFIKFLLRCKLLSMRGRLSPKGIYQYVIARTKYIDQVFNDATEKGFQQMLIMGAGFDSRAIRLLQGRNNVKVYEVDACTTLEAKLKQYKKRKISYPANNIHIPVDFEKEDIKARLKEAGFSKKKKTLFILEGLIMYLTQEAVTATFRLINECSPPGSLAVFDYIYASALRKENKYYGESAIYNRVKKDNEKWVFGIEEGQINEFLSQNNLALVEHLDSNVLENKYFKDETGKIITKVNGTHCIVLAKTKG